MNSFPPGQPDVKHLAEAVIADDVEKVRAILKARPELVNMETENDERRPIHHAVFNRSVEMARVLMEAGADSRKGIWPHRDATSAFTIVGERGYDDIVAVILEAEGRRPEPVHEFDPNAWPPEMVEIAHSRDEDRMFAFLESHPEFINVPYYKLDPDERVRVNGIEEEVYSAGAPLRECAEQGKLELAKILLEHGANPNAEVYASGSALFVAYGNKNWEMVRLLESHGGYLNAANAGYVRQTEVARKMLAGELDPRLEEGKYAGATLAEQLVWSGASGGDPEIVRMALEKVDWPRDDPRWFWILWRPLPGHGPWSSADRPLFIECFRRILDRCDPNLRTERFGQTMLHEVISRDYEDRAALARMLLDAGARTDVRDNLLKSTPLGWACRWGRIESVKLLLERGADPLETDAEPWATPRSWAQKVKRPDILQLLNSRASA